MASATPVKTDSVEVLAHQAATHPVTIVGSAISCLTKKSVTIFLYHGFVESASNATPGKFLVQTRPDAGDGSVTEHWVTVAEYVTNSGTPDTEAMTATEPVGETTLAVASTSGFTLTSPDNQLYIQDTGTLANSEWAEMKQFVANTNIQLIDGLTAEKDSSDVIFNDASRWVVKLDLRGVESFRVVWTHEGATGANSHIKALAITHDSDSIV